MKTVDELNATSRLFYERARFKLALSLILAALVRHPCTCTQYNFPTIDALRSRPHSNNRLTTPPTITPHPLNTKKAMMLLGFCAASGAEAQVDNILYGNKSIPDFYKQAVLAEGGGQGFACFAYLTGKARCQTRYKLANTTKLHNSISAN